MARARNPVVRTLLLVLGVLIILVSPILGVIPGPGGIFVFAAGLVLVLRNSSDARREFVRLKRRWPRFGRTADMALRRRSFRRRQSRLREAGLRAKDAPVAAATSDGTR